LNPIENGWAKLKKRIYMLYPDHELFDGTKIQLKKALL
jgi:transposase